MITNNSVASRLVLEVSSVFSEVLGELELAEQCRRVSLTYRIATCHLQVNKSSVKCNSVASNFAR